MSDSFNSFRRSTCGETKSMSSRRRSGHLSTRSLLELTSAIHPYHFIHSAIPISTLSQTLTASEQDQPVTSTQHPVLRLKDERRTTQGQAHHGGIEPVILPISITEAPLTFYIQHRFTKTDWRHGTTPRQKEHMQENKAVARASSSQHATQQLSTLSKSNHRRISEPHCRDQKSSLFHGAPTRSFFPVQIHKRSTPSSHVGFHYTRLKDNLRAS